VTADERRDENLILGRQLGQRRQREWAFDDDTRFDKAHAFDFYAGLSNKLGKIAPVTCHE
jgi:hypothetical protein